MLSIKSMSSIDAQHNLKVLAWLLENKEALEERAKNALPDQISAEEAQKRFHGTFTLLRSTRFLPAKIKIFTDEDALAFGDVIEPNVLLYISQDKSAFLVPDHFHTTDLSEVVKKFGIDGHEKAWRLAEK